jgi:hypothetical protein
VPCEAISVCPTIPEPLIAGGVADEGAVEGLTPEPTAAVGAEDALVDPTVLLAVTLTSTRAPTADEGRTNVVAVAPETGEHDAPLASQLFHW